MKRTLALILAVLMTVSCCVFVNAADTVTVTFYDEDGTTVLSTATVDPATGLTEAPSTPASSHDGVYFKVFSGWSLDGTVIDPTTLTYAADTSFTAVYETFGKIYDDPTAVTLPVVTPTEQEDGTVVGLLADGTVASEFNLLTEEADIAAAANGITFIYKVEGADTEIIADALNISVNAGASSGGANYTASQWANDNYKGGTSDGDYPYNFELNNGYFFIYVNDNLNNMNGKTADNTIKKLSVFDDDRSGEYTAIRTPENANANATVSILGYVNDNLQPTVNFYNGDSLIGSYTHAYTNVTKNLSFGTGSGQANSVVEGALLTPAEIFAASGLTTPTKASTDTTSYIFNGWIDAEGNAIDAVYTNMDVYADYTEVEKTTYTVTFVDKDGAEVTSGTVETGALYTGEIGADQATWNDGVFSYVFAGWSIDGETVVDPAAYIYTENTTFKPVFTQLGAIMNHTPEVIGDGSAIQNLTFDPVALPSDVTGVTIVYKIEGADSTIIADELVVGFNGTNSAPAWQWCEAAYSSDGLAAACFDIVNGVHYMYINRNLSGTVASFSRFTLFATHKVSNYHSTHTVDPTNNRGAVNTNANATIQLLAVMPNNLQPTVTFYDADGAVYGTYQHKYTEVTSNLGYSNNAKSYQEGDIITVSEALELAELTAPEKEGTDEIAYIFNGWEDADGNKVEYVYNNVAVYPTYLETTKDTYIVKFVDKNGDELLATTAVTGGPLVGDLPDDPATYSDGIYTYVFAGWSIDGTTVVDPVEYDYMGEVTFVPVYTTYGEVYENPTAVSIPQITEDSPATKLDIPAGDITLNSDYTGMTFVFKVDGAESEIIADHFYYEYTRTNGGTGTTPWQWCNDNPAPTSDGLPCYMLELNNGYYYMYVNRKLMGNDVVSIKNLVLFGTHNANGHHNNHNAGGETSDYTADLKRENVNDNENAAFTLLAVVQDNLQPTITFMDGDNTTVLGTYKHSYTSETSAHSNYQNPNSYQEGTLIGGAKAYELSGLAKPTKEGTESTEYVLSGWVDADGNAVDAIYTNITLYPTFTEIPKEEYTVIFLNRDGTTNTVATAFTGEGLTSEYPATLENVHDGVYLYRFEGWSIDGETVVDVTTYDYMDDVIFVPVWTTFGVVYDDPTAQSIPTDTSAEVNFMTETVPVAGDANGITFVYKIDGVTEDIIADNFMIATRNSANAAWQWDEANYCVTGDGSANVMTVKNGYFFVYANDNVNGMNGQPDNVINKFAFFYPYDANMATSERTPVNNNENATLTMQAVLNDNLQPTVNFYNGNTVIGSYTHKYSDVNKNLGYGTSTAQNNSVVKGELLTPAEIYDLSTLPTPTKASDDTYFYTFAGWTDADGNEIDAVYTNMDVYAKFTATEKTGDTYTVTFMDGEEVLGTYEAVAGENPFFADPTKADSATGTYTFTGWALTADGEAVDLGDIKVEGDMTIYATFEYKDVTFTVTYFDNGTQIYQETVIRSNDAAYTKVPTRPTDAYVEGEDGYYHVFDKWVDAEGNAVDLTNIQADLVVYSSFKDVLVENWWTITWVDSDGQTVLDTAVVANGEGASTSVMGKLHYTGTETTVYNFTGWDKKTTNVTSDITVTALYTETDIETAANTVIAEGSGTVGTQNDLIADYTYVSSGNKYITLIFDIEGATEDNPITIGAIRTNILGIDSNNSGNYPTDTAAIRGVTADGKYYVTFGIQLLTWTTSTFSTINSLSIDYASASRGGKSEGEATYDVVAIEGALQPTVRFFDEDGNWLYTAKNYYALSNTTYYFNEVPTAAGMYAGPEVDGLTAWVDADGNEVTYVTENMDVYAKGAHECSYTVATGAGTAACECGKVSDTAFTIIADPSTEVSEIKAGETVTIPVIVNNGAFAGATLKVVTSDNVTLTAIDAAGTLFEGYTAVLGDTIVLNEALSGVNVTEDGIIVYLTLTAVADIAADDVITVQVDAEQVVDIADAELVVADGYVASYTVVAAEADVLWGDVDGSGAIDGTDTMLLSRYTSGWGEDDYADAIDLMTAGDVDGSGVIDGTDTMLLSRYTSGWGESDYADAVNLLKSLEKLG